MLNNLRTIEAEGFFGTKSVTKEKFQQLWIKHTRQLLNISFTGEWEDEVNVMIEKVKEATDAEFERVYKRQQMEES